MDEPKIFSLYNASDPNRIESFNGHVNSVYKVEQNSESFEADFEWLELMEETIPYLDNILRNPNRFIVNEEEIVNVEKARRITVESIKHLSKNTNFIQEINEQGEVKPSKILNINKDESYNTYENRVIYTLIQNMRMYVDLKKRNLVTSSYYKDAKKFEYTGSSKVAGENININVAMESRKQSNKEYKGSSEMPVDKRIEKLELHISDLTNTEVYKTLAKEHVAKVIPPVKKTNLILKNTNFQYAMKLWNYLAENPEVSNKAVKDRKVYKDNKATKGLFDDVFLLNYLAVNDIDETASKEKLSREVIERVTNNMINKIIEINTDMPLEQLENIIGDKIAIIRNKKMASIEEVEKAFNSKIQSALSKIINFKFVE